MHQNDKMLDVECQNVGEDLRALADAIPHRKAFRTELRKRLVAQAQALDAGKEETSSLTRMQQQQEVRTLGTKPQDKREARSPLWLQRLAPGAGRIGQVFQLGGGLAMKKGFALAAVAILVIALGTVAFVPSVRAQVGEILSTWFRFESPGGEYGVAIGGPMEFTPLHPTYLPAGLGSSGSGISAFAGSESESIELTYHNYKQFIAITQTKAPADKVLPAGQETTVSDQPAVLVTDLEGTFEYGFRIPEGAHVETVGTPPAEPAPYHGTIAYTDGKRLTWYAGDVKVEMLSNLSEEEMLKIAESLVPAEAGEGKAPFQPSLGPPSGGEEKVIETEGGHIIIREGSIESNP